jgi:hypothetical protein
MDSTGTTHHYFIGLCRNDKRTLSRFRNMPFELRYYTRDICVFLSTLSLNSQFASLLPEAQ